MQECLDFIIDLGAAESGGHPVRVLESPAGEARGRFVPPLSGAEVRRFLEEVAYGSRRDLVAHPARRPAPPSARELGERLFDALFRGEVGERFFAGRHRAEAAGRGLRIVLRIDPAHPGAARLHSLPWELLYRPESRGFLARSRRTPLVRYLEVPQPAELPPVPSPLRIVMVMASPRGVDALDLEAERGAIEKVWSRHRAIEIATLPREGEPRATLRALRRSLLERETHVVHFMGHGGFDPQSGRGTLCFESDDGSLDRASGEDLAELLEDFESTRLVTLNACHSGEAADEEGRNPFAGVATALVHRGVPAVVAMQAAISDRAAIAFSRELYHRLAAGDPIDAAVVEGRRAIGRPGRTDEWATPMLFLRAPEGKVFAPPPAGRAPVERPPGWHWSGSGAVYLALGALGLAALVGLGFLALSEQPELRAAIAAMAALAGALATFLLQRDPIPGRLLSHWVARRRAARWGLLCLPLLALAAWVLAGERALCRSRCGELCPPPGTRYVAVERFESQVPGAAEAGARWAAETSGFLAQAFSKVDGLQPRPAVEQLDKRTLRCVDVAIRGGVREAGAQVVLSAELWQRGRYLAAVEARGEPAAPDGGLIALERRLALEVLRALGVEVGGGLAAEIARFPTLDAEALELNRRGVASFLEGDLLEAGLRFAAALERDAGYADAANNLGLVELRQGRHEAAIGHFEQAIERLPRHPSYHFNLGLALDLGGRPRRAAAAYGRALELDPSHARAHNNLGFVLLGLGELGAARTSLERALAHARDDAVEATVYKNLGRVALAGGAAGEALEHLGKAIERFDPYPEALFYRARALEELGRAGETCDAWRLYAAVAGNDADAERRREGRQRASALGCEKED